MKKLLTVATTVLLLCSTLIVSGVNSINDDEVERVYNISFDALPIVSYEDGFSTIEIEGITGSIADPCKPDLPVYSKTFELPKDVKIDEIDVSVVSGEQLNVDIPVRPAVTPQPLSDLTDGVSLERTMDAEVYALDAYYPEMDSSYSITCGLNEEGTPTTFVTVEVYPIRYNPVEGTLLCNDAAEISISYELPESDAASAADEYDMVIITSEEFASLCDDFVAHKNSVGVRTYVKTVDEIYPEYDGRDDPEDIKLFIKDAVETQNITYVLLLGGLDSYWFAEAKEDTNYGSKDYHVPVRYGHVDQGDENSCMSDLYYADLYRYNEDMGAWEFEDWDENGNGIFCEYTTSVQGKDVLDLNPDVYYGRLPVRSAKECTRVLQKIITYESTGPSEKSWYSHMVAVAGRTFSMYEDQPDAEWSCDQIIDMMGDMVTSVEKCYVSHYETGGSVPEPSDVTAAISEGAGFVLFEGHGSPSRWNTHYVDDDNRTKDVKLYDFLFKLTNGDELPFVVIGGCHNGLFNVSFIPVTLNAIFNYKTNYIKFWTPEPIPMCFSWSLVFKEDGGAIASTGCTGYGLGGGDPISMSSELEANVFELIGNGTATAIGAAHSGAITKFILENNVRKSETHCITIFELFSDPSLQLGGYE